MTKRYDIIIILVNRRIDKIVPHTYAEFVQQVLSVSRTYRNKFYVFRYK